jgi:hypothetical protein
MHWSLLRRATIGVSNRGKVFSMRSVNRCYKQDIWGNELVVGQSSAGKNVHTEAENTVGPSPGNDWLRHSRLRRLSVCCSELMRV